MSINASIALMRSLAKRRIDVAAAQTPVAGNAAPASPTKIIGAFSYEKAQTKWLRKLLMAMQ
jgi:hypothetical protein